MILTHLSLPTLLVITILDYKDTTAWTLSRLDFRSSSISNQQMPTNLFLSNGNTNANDFSLNVPFVTGVTLKMAFDQQWAVADMSETKSERFTSPASLDLVHKLRATSDAVLVGRATVQRDDCTLTVRRVPLIKKEQPVRVVIDTNLVLLLKDDVTDYTIFTDGLPLIIYHQEDKRMTGLSDDLVGLPREPSGLLSTSSILQDLGSRNIHHVMVEGGPTTAMSFLRDKSIDRAILIFAPILFQEPYPSFINETIMIQSGLEKLGSFECDGDQVQCWSRPGLPWPTERLQDWP